MPRAYSMDLRQRVIAACAAGTQPRHAIAAQFQISEGTLYDWLRRWRERGSYAPAPHAGGVASGLNRAVLRDLAEEENDRTLAEYADAYQERTGRRFSVPRICTALKEMKLSRIGRRSDRRDASSFRLPRKGLYSRPVQQVVMRRRFGYWVRRPVPQAGNPSAGRAVPTRPGKGYAPTCRPLLVAAGDRRCGRSYAVSLFLDNTAQPGSLQAAA